MSEPLSAEEIERIRVEWSADPTLYSYPVDRWLATVDKRTPWDADRLAAALVAELDGRMMPRAVIAADPARFRAALARVVARLSVSEQSR